MSLSVASNPYQRLNKVVLIAALLERDETILAQQKALHDAAAEYKKISRTLDLRNKRLFGSSSEKSKKQTAEVEVPQSVVETAGQSLRAPDSAETAAAIETKKKEPKTYPNGHPGRRPIPENIPREIRHLYPEGHQPSWNRELPPEVTEQLTLKIEFKVIQTIFHKYARGNDIVKAPVAENDPFYKYKATTELVCQMMNLRFGLHMPYYRFLQLLPGCDLNYSTIMGWAARFFELLAPLGPVLAKEIVKNAMLLHMDESHFNLLDTPARIKAYKDELIAQGANIKKLFVAGRKGTNNNQPAPPAKEKEEDASMQEEVDAGIAKGKILLRGQIWAQLNPLAKLVMFMFSPNRSALNAISMLVDYAGPVMTDAYSGYSKLEELSRGEIIHLKCLVHCRRKFIDAQDPKYRDPVVKEIIQRIGSLYAIEKIIKGRSPGRKKKARRRSAKILARLKLYIESKIDDYVLKEPVRMAMQYFLNNWKGLFAYTKHKHGVPDNNPVERTIRQLTIARKNIMFLGSVDHAAGASLLYSLAECCRLNNINLQEWLLDVTSRIGNCTKEQLADLLPHKWKKVYAEIRTAR